MSDAEVKIPDPGGNRGSDVRPVPEVVSDAAVTIPDSGVVLDWLLKRRLEDLTATFRASWDIYIKFYTVFLTFSIAALVFFVQMPRTGSNRPKYTIAIVFAAQGLLTAITSVYMAVYSSQTKSQQQELEEALLDSIKTHKVLGKAKALPMGLAIWAGSANAAGMLGIIGVWIYEGFFSG